MESYNNVTLLGRVDGEAKLSQHSDGPGGALFNVVTRNASVDQCGGKIKEDVIHVVLLKRPGTIGKYLTHGKPVMVVGSLQYSNHGCYVEAEKIVFPERRGR